MADITTTGNTSGGDSATNKDAGESPRKAPRLNIARRIPRQNLEPHPTPTPAQSQRPRPEARSTAPDKSTTEKYKTGSPTSTIKVLQRKRKTDANQLRLDQEHEGKRERRLPFRIPNFGRTVSSSYKEESFSNAGKLIGSSPYAVPTSRLTRVERFLERHKFGTPTLPAFTPLNKQIPVIPSANISLIPPNRPVMGGPFSSATSGTMRADSVNLGDKLATEGSAMAFPATPTIEFNAPVTPFAQAGTNRDFLSNGTVLPCALAGNRYVDPVGLPVNVYTALENYITGADNNGGVVDEIDRMYQMGVQAGIGHGITHFKAMLTHELELTGRLFGRKVARDDVGQSRKEQADLIRACETYDLSAAKITADDHIQIQLAIRPLTQPLAVAQSAQNGVVDGYSIGPEAMSNANITALPGQPGYHMADTHADLAALAGLPTIGGLDLTQMDGYAGLMTNAYNDAWNKQNNQTAGGQNSMSGFRTGDQPALPESEQGYRSAFQFGDKAIYPGNEQANNGAGLATGKVLTQDSPDGNHTLGTATAMLTETKDGRAVIRLVPEKH